MSAEDGDTTKTNKLLFPDIDAEDDDPEVMEVECYCMNCEEQVCFSLYYTF